MKLSTLSDWDLHTLASPSSFAKGQSYYDTEAVLDFHIIEGEIVASVYGSSIYRVRIDEKMNARCSCPYDRWGRCKHLVAVALHYFDHREWKVVTDISKNISPKKWSNLKDILSKRKKKQLIEFIINSCKEHPYLADKIFISVADPWSKWYHDYLNEVQLLFKQAGDRYGYIEYGEEIDFGNYFHLIDQAISAENYQTAKDITQALLETIDKELEDIDDSSGYYRGERQEACEQFRKSAPHCTDKKELFDYFLNQAERSNFFAYEYYHSAQSLCTTTDDRVQWAEVIKEEALKYDPSKDTRDQHDIYKKYLSYCKALIESNQIEVFLDLAEQSYLSNNEIALMYITILHEHKSADQALQSAYRFLDIHKDDRRGYRNIQEHIIQRHSDLDQDDRAIAMLLQLVLEDKKMDDYDKLKSMVTKKERATFFVKIEKECNWSRFLIDIYLVENQKDKAWKVVQASKSKQTASQYEKHFIDDYPEYYFDLYKKDLEKRMETSHSRKTYTEWTRELKKLQSIKWYKQTILDFIEEVKDMYPRRCAMLEEFEKAWL